MRVVRPEPSPAVLPLSPAGVSEVSRFSCMKLPDVSGVFDYAGLNGDSRYRPRPCCLPPSQKRRRPDCIFSKLNTQPACTPVYASPCTSRCLTQNSGPSGSLLLSREDSCIPCFMPVYPGALTWRFGVNRDRCFLSNLAVKRRRETEHARTPYTLSRARINALALKPLSYGLEVHGGHRSIQARC